MQILFRNVFRAAMTPIKSTIVIIRLARMQSANMGFSRLETTSELGAIRGFKTSANLFRKNKHHLRRQAEKLQEKGTGGVRAIEIALLGGMISAAIGLCVVAILGLRISADSSTNTYSPMWPKYVKDRIHLTSAYVGGTIFIACLVAVACIRSPTLMNLILCFNSFVLLSTFISTAGIGKAIRMIPFQPDEIGAKHLAWAAFSVLLGGTLAVMSRHPLLLETITIALSATSGLNIIILCAPSKELLLYKLGPAGLFLGAVMGIVLVSLWELPVASGVPTVPSAHICCVQLFFIMIFLGLVLFRTNMVIKHAETLPPEEIYDPINAAMSILLSD